MNNKNCYNCKHAHPIELWNTECRCDANIGFKVDDNLYMIDNPKNIKDCDKWEKIK